MHTMGDGGKRTLAAESCWGASPYLKVEIKNQGSMTGNAGENALEFSTKSLGRFLCIRFGSRCSFTDIEDDRPVFGRGRSQVPWGAERKSGMMDSSSESGQGDEKYRSSS